MVPSCSSATRSASSTVDAPVGHDDRRDVGQHPAQRLLDQRLGVDVERGQRVVEHQHGRPGQHRAGQRQPLALAAGQAHALLADARVQAPRQVVDEAGLGHLERLGDLLAAWRPGGRG